MKILVTGVNGQLGYDVVRELQKRGHEPIGVDIEEMDITRKAEVEKVWEKVQPDGVIHCAAYTAVDRAEDEEELCREVNAAGTRNIAEVCKKNHGVMTVSYTHLDVYKRQMHMWIILPLDLPLSAGIWRQMDIKWGLFPSRIGKRMKVLQSLENHGWDFLFAAEIWTQW